MDQQISKPQKQHNWRELQRWVGVGIDCTYLFPGLRAGEDEAGARKESGQVGSGGWIRGHPHSAKLRVGYIRLEEQIGGCSSKLVGESRVFRRAGEENTNRISDVYKRPDPVWLVGTHCWLGSICYCLPHYTPFTNRKIIILSFLSLNSSTFFFFFLI